MWRMFGMFKNGSVAVSWESSEGGFVQHTNGLIALSVNSTGGTHYDLDGTSVIHRWKWEDEPQGIPESQGTQVTQVTQGTQGTQGIPESVVSGRPPPLSLKGSSEGIPESVVVCLDPSSLVGAVFTPASRELRVFMTGPDGLRVAFVCGRNVAHTLWTDDDFQPSQPRHGRRA